MRSSGSFPAVRRAALAVLALALLPATLAAQAPGRIAGTVTSQEGTPVHGAQVSVLGTRLGALTNAAGQFVVTGVPAGAHEVRIAYVGFREEVRTVEVRAGEATTLDVQLEGRPVELGGVVVSAARREQRITEAPATITRIGPEVIDHTVGNNFAAALKQAVGLDFIQVGMTSVAVNARGFNSSFNNRMLMLEDGRVAVLPESGLPVGQFTTMPKVDLAGIEVLVGPGAALYGADASSGVLTLLSKDPRQYPGTTVEVTGGNRAYRNVQARHAGVAGDWGYKASAEFQQANDWSNQICYTAACIPEVGVGGAVDWRSQVIRGQGALVRYFGDGRFEIAAGASQTDGVGQTNVGRNQFDGWTYNFLQARLSTPNWFAQLYRTQSKAGDSYAINRFTENKAANPGKSDEEIRLMSDWPSDGRIYAAEIQNNFRLPALLNTHLVWGAQYRRDVVSSERQWLTDRLTGEDIEIGQYGLYAQLETPLAPWLDLVVAGRYDDHENYDAQWSPKAGVVFKPAADQAVRVTYNRAFKSPTILQTNFYIPDFTPIVSVWGNTEGWTVQNAAGEVLVRYDPLRPEQNQTWEVGYKGVLGNRLFLDVTGYRSRYQDFLSPLVAIANSLPTLPAANRTYAVNGRGEIVNGPGQAALPLIYFNLGRATLRGVDAGLKFYAAENLNLTGTFSWLDLSEVEVPAGREEATSLNSPNTKWTLGVNHEEFGRILGGSFFGGLTARHVNSYYFRSGINMGVVPTFTTLDANVGYRIPRWNSTVQLSVANLFTCRAEYGYGTAQQDPLRQAPISKERECGFDKRHLEMINMPEIGTMVFLGVRYHTP